MRTFTRPTNCFSVLAIAFAILASGLNTAWAQQKWESLPIAKEYKMINLDDVASSDMREARQRNSETKRALSAARKNALDFMKGDSSDGAGVKTFMESYLIPQMTQTDQQTLSSLGELRADFFKRYLSDKTSQGNRTSVINQILVPNFSNIAANDKMHPAVRHNAVVALGQLDTTPADRLGGTPPTPTPAAQQFLINLFNGDSPGYLKVAALAGIQRAMTIQTAQGRAPTAKAAIGGELLAIANGAGKGNETWSDDLKYWMKRRAVQCLGLLKDPGGQGQVVAALRTLIKDDSPANTWVRFDALQALAGMNIRPDQVKGLSYEVGAFFATTLLREGNTLDEDLDELIRKNLIFSNRDLLAEQSKGKRGGRAGDQLSAGGGGNMEQLDGGSPAQGAKKERVPSVNLPNYRMNATRRRAKVIAYYIQQAYKTDSLLLKAAETNQETDFVKSMVEVARLAISETDIGITDVDENTTKGNEDRSFTKQISEALVRLANELNDKLPESAKIKTDAKPEKDASEPASEKTAEEKKDDTAPKQ